MLCWLLEKDRGRAASGPQSPVKSQITRKALGQGPLLPWSLDLEGEGHHRQRTKCVVLTHPVTSLLHSGQ